MEGATRFARLWGGAIVAAGKVFCGTNNENPRNERDRGTATKDDPLGPPLDKGILMCFDGKTGEFIWQAVHDKLIGGQVNDWPREGLCSTPVVQGDRIYYCTNRCTVVCADVNGFANGNQGFQDEQYKDTIDGDIIWELNMMADLGVFPHNMTAGSPLIAGNLLFVVTANGVDEGHINMPSPEAPSFLCLDKTTGKVVWKSNAPGAKIMHAQWSHPAYGVIHGVPQVIFPGGDGWLRAFAPDTGVELWRFDANPKDSKYELGSRCTRSDFIGAPVIYKEKIYIGTGQDPEHFEGTGHFWCIDPVGKSGDISPELVTDASKDPPATKPNPNSAVVWHYGGEEKREYAKRDYVFGRTMSTACIVDDICYISELAGYLHVLDAKTGKSTGGSIGARRFGVRRITSTARFSSAAKTATYSFSVTIPNRRNWTRSRSPPNSLTRKRPARNSSKFARKSTRSTRSPRSSWKRRSAAHPLSPTACSTS